MATTNHKWVGTKIRMDSAYFEDVDDVTVEETFEYETKIIRYVPTRGKHEERWVFEDHEGHENFIDLETLRKLSIMGLSEESDQGHVEPKGTQFTELSIRFDGYFAL